MRPQIILILVLFLLAIGCSSSMYTTFKCPPDDRLVNVIKDINKAYPVYASTYNINLGNLLSYADSISTAEPIIKFSTGVEKLRDNLNQENSAIQMLLKTSLLGLQVAPCDTNRLNAFWKLLDKISENALKLLTFQEQLENDVAKIMYALQQFQDFDKLKDMGTSTAIITAPIKELRHKYNYKRLFAPGQFKTWI